MRWLIAGLLTLTLSACEQNNTTLPQIAAGPRLALVADDVTVQIRIDPSQFPTVADQVADDVATLLGPPTAIREIGRAGLILLMNGRFDRQRAEDGRLIYIMDWDVREPGGTQVTLFRVGIVPQDPMSSGISERDAQGLAWFVADRLTRDEAVRAIVLARRS
ncbi:hypothetical protein [Pontivivens insulae]|uniref:Uncharacterized protein n=1 Tax=Pontivivens insulae TaxID=1639689 RepID=A0A2R8ADZ2_9RHOB|nr:hypothetical protein [Pontivivens insulae]RED14404.1 hypothetical protein DFR53_1763 [Pontivivens insulae]SPF30481.1 hypothetical protein POI8812_02819 [Pontivivens insulae]